MVRTSDLIEHLDGLLDPGSFEDMGPNGLQVPGPENIEVLVTGVTAQLELFERAAELGGDLVLCHHGLLWDFLPRRIDAKMKRRLQALFGSDMALAAYHLPLDAHEGLGNNALACDALGLEQAERFGAYRGRSIGYVARSSDGLSLPELRRRCHHAFGQEPLVVGDGPERVHSVGIVSGAAASSLPEAVEAGLDAFITGEPAEHVMADARENGIHFLACGHYATETLGVRRLGDLVAERFDLRHHFVDIPNPI